MRRETRQREYPAANCLEKQRPVAPVRKTAPASQPPYYSNVNRRMLTLISSPMAIMVVAMDEPP